MPNFCGSRPIRNKRENYALQIFGAIWNVEHFPTTTDFVQSTTLVLTSQMFISECIVCYLSGTHAWCRSHFVWTVTWRFIAYTWKSVPEKWFGGNWTDGLVLDMFVKKIIKSSWNGSIFVHFASTMQASLTWTTQNRVIVAARKHKTHYTLSFSRWNYKWFHVTNIRKKQLLLWQESL